MDFMVNLPWTINYWILEGFWHIETVKQSIQMGWSCCIKIWSLERPLQPENWPESKWNLLFPLKSKVVFQHSCIKFTIDRSSKEVLSVSNYQKNGKSGKQKINNQFMIPSSKLTWQWKMDLLKMYSLLKMRFFHCHVSLLECKHNIRNLQRFTPSPLPASAT